MFTRTDDKISTTQASIFLTDSVLGAGILTLPRSVAVAAQTPDVWLSLLIGGGIAIVMVVVMVKLCQQFPGMTVFQFSKKIVGNVPAIILCLLMVINFIVISGFEIRVLAEVNLFFLLEGTPMWAVIIPLIWLSCYLLFGGINAIARVFQIIFPISVVILVISYILSLRMFDINNLRPFMGDGLLPIVNGLKATLLAFAGFEVILVIVAYMDNPKKAMKAMITGISMPIIIYLITIIVVIGGMSMGAVLRSTWPTIDLLRSFEVAGLFFERMEFLFLVIWMMQLFCNFTSFYFSASIGISQLFKVRYTWVIFGLMPLIYITAITPKRINNVFQMGSFIGWSAILLFGLVLLILWGMLLIRRVGFKHNV